MGEGYAKLIADQGYSGAVDGPSFLPIPVRRQRDSTIPESRERRTRWSSPSTARRRKSCATLEPWKAVTDVLMTVLPAGMPWRDVEATLRAVAG